MLSAFKRFLSRLSSREASSEDLSSGWREALKISRAAPLRDALRQSLAGDERLSVVALLSAAREAGWPAIEVERLAAYADFYSGEVARGYERVIQAGLASTDYAMFSTACAYCYDYDRFEEGYALLRQFRPAEATDLDPVRFAAYAGYLALCGGGGVDEACSYFDPVLVGEPGDAMFAVNAYAAYFEAGRHEQVRKIRRLMAEHHANDPEAIYAMACVELARDYYPEGFRLAEARYRMPEVARSLRPELFGKPRWQGEPLAGRRLLVLGEQGLGDIVMMARYLPLLVARAREVIVDCQLPAVPLLAANFPGCRFHSSENGGPTAVDCDCWIGMMSLPRWFDTTAETVPATAGYLVAPAEQAEYWHRRCRELARPRAPRVGLAWSGNPRHRADRRRSLAWSQIEGFVRQSDGMDFFAMQTSVPTAPPPNLIDVSEEMLTLADTAALVAEMDLVITVDTSVVHIAGALGKETWLLLPHRYEWRWSLAGERNNWYDSVRVFRLERCGVWDSLLADLFGRRLPGWLREQAPRP
jgi:hypothetical protein